VALKRNIIINADSVQTVLKNHESVSEQQVSEATDDPIEQARLVAGVNNALIEIRDHEESADVLSSPPSEIASQLQSFLAQQAAEENKDIKRTLPAGGVEAQFDTHDWLGWAGSFFTWIGKLKKEKWRDPSSVEPMGDDARMALFGDWGTGLYGAPAISQCVSADKNGFSHVLHIGDVYYSGTTSEIDERFIAFWPKVKDAKYRACNSNHEMYSGGHGYFNKTLPLFGQASSCFGFENDKWLVVGLDTAYEEHSLTKQQLGWLMLLLNDPTRKNKKLVLISHHQPYSLLDTQGPKVISFLRLLLDSGRIYAWYWGHEHRCVMYDRHPLWNLAGRCIGHGGYPYFRDTKTLTKMNAKPVAGSNGSTWYRLDGQEKTADESRVPGGLKIPSGIVLDGANEFLDDEADKYGPHGYIVLEFLGDELYETYYQPMRTGPSPMEVWKRQKV
jgi:Calcineurin-like phosphoesterase